MQHTRKQIMAKRLAAHGAREMQPFKAPVTADGIYCHVYKPKNRPAQIISNSTGRPVE